jgi:hypothetical protein
MKLSIVIPHFNSSSYRERNLKYTIEHYAKALPNVKIIISEQISEGIEASNIGHLLYKYENVSWVNVRCPDVAFRKSLLINDAVKNSVVSEYVAVIDNDCVLQDVKLIDLIPIEDCSVFIPYTSINFLRESHTRQLIKQGEFTQSKPRQDMHIDKYTGGINVFSVENFNTVGGFDESFINWGAEDDAFHIKCTRLIGPITRSTQKHELLHLWHPNAKTTEHIESAAYAMNKKRVACFKRMELDDLLEYTALTGEAAVSELNRLLNIYESLGKLHTLVKIRIGHETITMDSTVYDVPTSTKGEVLLVDMLECIVNDEGPEYLLGTISQIRHNIKEIDAFSNAILSRFESIHVS